MNFLTASGITLALNMDKTPSLLMTAKDLADSMQIGMRSVWRMDAAGELPRPANLPGRLKRWRRDEILAWLDADCPDRREWELFFKNAKPAGSVYKKC